MSSFLLSEQPLVVRTGTAHSPGTVTALLTVSVVREEPFTVSEKNLTFNVSLQLCMGRKTFRVLTIVRIAFSQYAQL